MFPTIRDVLRDAKKRIEPVSQSAGLDSHVLLSAVLGVERAYLLLHPNRNLTREQQERFEALVARCAAGEPLAYILGRRGFYDREFFITPAVLIPRPETELLLEQALVFLKGCPEGVAVDVGTGSGALAVTVAALCPQAAVYAVDISPAALDVARHNAAEHGVDERVVFFEDDLLTPLLERNLKANIIMANLPYVASGDLAELAVSRYEPHLALDGGEDGLDLVRRLLAQAPAVLHPGGRVLLEIGADQGAAAWALAHAAFPQARVEVIPDYAGLDRIIRITDDRDSA
jgi:release factor glutamine methyltransferase